MQKPSLAHQLAEVSARLGDEATQAGEVIHDTLLALGQLEIRIKGVDSDTILRTEMVHTDGAFWRMTMISSDEQRYLLHHENPRHQGAISFGGRTYHPLDVVGSAFLGRRARIITDDLVRRLRTTIAARSQAAQDLAAMRSQIAGTVSAPALAPVEPANPDETLTLTEQLTRAREVGDPSQQDA